MTKQLSLEQRAKIQEFLKQSKAENQKHWEFIRKFEKGASSR